MRPRKECRCRMVPPAEDDRDTVTTNSGPVDDVAGSDSTDPDVPDIPGVLDWVLGGLVAFGGLLFALAGFLVFTVPDRENVETVVATEDFQVEGMTEPEFVELTLATLPWIAAGLLLTGLAMIVLGGAYIVHRRRARNRAATGTPTDDYLAHALLGAVVSAVLSFIPFSGIIGGGLAGYLERGDSERTISVGAASGVLMSAPFLVLGLFVTAGLIAGSTAIDNGGFAVVNAVAVIGGGLVSLGIATALGAIGGWIGGKLAE